MLKSDECFENTELKILAKILIFPKPVINTAIHL